MVFNDSLLSTTGKETTNLLSKLSHCFAEPLKGLVKMRKYENRHKQPAAIQAGPQSILATPMKKLSQLHESLNAREHCLE